MSLDEKMKNAGMMTIDEMKKSLLANQFLANAEVVDLGSFRDYLHMRFEEMARIKAKMILDKKDDDELYEWVVSHAAAFGEVLANFEKAMLKYRPADDTIN